MSVPGHLPGCLCVQCHQGASRGGASYRASSSPPTSYQVRPQGVELRDVAGESLALVVDPLVIRELLASAAPVVEIDGARFEVKGRVASLARQGADARVVLVVERSEAANLKVIDGG